MPEFRIENLRSGYVDLVNWVKLEGKPTAPRGQKTVEIENAMIHLDDVYDALPVGTGRGISKGIAAVEACQLLGGVSRPNLVIQIGPVFQNYTEDNGTFHGAYGPRTFGQFGVMANRLRADPDSRQAVTTIWDPNFDLLEEKRDYPCTLSFMFRLRNGRLNMTTTMRSNDVIKGVAYDFFQFTRVQIALAAVLGVQPGTYTHVAGSFHLYESDGELVEKLHYPTLMEQEVFTPAPALVGSTWDEVEQLARDALNVAEHVNMKYPITQEQAWYAGAMINAMRRNKRLRTDA
jgi:thymidylate synthase